MRVTDCWLEDRTGGPRLGIALEGRPGDASKISVVEIGGSGILEPIQQTLTIDAKGSGVIFALLRPDHAARWTPERPVLYSVEIRLLDRDTNEQLDLRKVQWGISSLTVIGRTAFRDGSRWFLHGLRAGPAALSHPGQLASLAASVHADLLVCSAAPSEDLLRICDRRGIAALAPPDATPTLAHSPHPCLLTAPEGLALREFTVEHPNYSSREIWALELAQALSHARLEASTAGFCLVDAEMLLGPEGEALQWHLACCYRRVQLGAHRAPLAGWTGEVRVPVISTLTTPLSQLEIRWELLDGAAVVGRGAAAAQDETSTVHCKVRTPGSPGSWTGEPRLRLRFYAPTAAPSPAGLPHTPASSAPRATIAAAAGEVLILRRSAPPVPAPQVIPGFEETGQTLQPGGGSSSRAGPIAVGAAGPEIGRLEVSLEIQAPVECVLQPSPRLGIAGEGAAIAAALINRTGKNLQTELRLTLHAPSRRVIGLGVESLELPPGEKTVSVAVPAEALEEGSNYLMAGFRSPLGVGLVACLIYRAAGPGTYCYLGNTLNCPAHLWIWPEAGEAPPIRVDLEGGEEKGLPLAWRTAEEKNPVPDPLRDLRWWLQDLETGEVLPTDGEFTGGNGLRSLLLRDPVGGEDGAAGEHTIEGTCYPDGLIRILWRVARSVRDRGSNTGKPGRRIGLAISSGERAGLWTRMTWQRQPLWDAYPRDHPDAAAGALDLDPGKPLQLSNLERLTLIGETRGLAILTSGSLLDAAILPGSLVLSVAEGFTSESSMVEFGLLPVPDADAADGMWLRRPEHVHEVRWETGDA